MKCFEFWLHSAILPKQSLKLETIKKADRNFKTFGPGKVLLKLTEGAVLVAVGFVALVAAVVFAVANVLQRDAPLVVASELH